MADTKEAINYSVEKRNIKGYSIQEARMGFGGINRLPLCLLNTSRNRHLYRLPIDNPSGIDESESVAIVHPVSLLVIFRVHPDHVNPHQDNKQIANGLSNDLISYITKVGINLKSLPLDLICYLDNFFKTLKEEATILKSKTPLSVMDSDTLGLSLIAAKLNPDEKSITVISLGRTSFAWVEKGNNRMKVKKTPLPPLANMMFPYYPTLQDLTKTSFSGEFRSYGNVGRFPWEYLEHYPLILSSRQIARMPADFPALQAEALVRRPDMILGQEPRMITAIIGGNN